MSMGEAIQSMTANAPTWDDLAWIRSRWSGPVLAKGVLTAAEATCAVAAGVDGIIVSNHGGRQLDGVSATLPALVEIADAVGDQVEVLVDGGIRRGSDVARALAAGARAVMVGRPWTFALAAGQPGVERMLEILAPTSTERFVSLAVHRCTRWIAVTSRSAAPEPARRGPTWNTECSAGRACT